MEDFTIFYIMFHTVEEKYKDYFKFTTVSNPFRRAIASWKPLIYNEPYRKKRGWLKRVGGEDFLTFTRYLKKIKQQNIIPPKKHLVISQTSLHPNVNFDMILHLQNLQEEFNQLPFVKEHIEVPVSFTHNKKGTRHYFEGDDWKKLYNDEAIQNVLYAWGEDFDTYGYSKEL